LENSHRLDFVKKNIILYIQVFSNGELKDLKKVIFGYKDLKNFRVLKEKCFFLHFIVFKSFGCGLADFGKIAPLRRGFQFFFTPVSQAKKNYM
jgi:hypothetical protein